MQLAEERTNHTVGLHGAGALDAQLAIGQVVAAQGAHIGKVTIRVRHGQLHRSALAVDAIAQALPLRVIQNQLQAIAADRRLQLRLHIGAATLGLEEQRGRGQQGHADATTAEHQQELAALAVDQQQRDHGHHRIEQLDRHVGAVGH